MYQLRDYQKQLINEIFRSWKTNRRVMAQLVTGAGKTILFAHIARSFLEQGEGVLVVAHRKELIIQAKEKLESISGLEVGIIKAGYPSEFHKDIQVASVQSLNRRKKYPDAGLLVIDECFPCGTLVDGKPIETINVGDYVTAFDEKSGLVSRKKVLRTFNNPAPNKLVTIKVGERNITCTPNHPVLTLEGWKPAINVTIKDKVGVLSDENAYTDMRMVFTGVFGNHGHQDECEKKGTCLLLKRMLQSLSRENQDRKTGAGINLYYLPETFCYQEGVPKKALQRKWKSLLFLGMQQSLYSQSQQSNSSANQSQIRIFQDETQQSYVQSGEQKEGIKYSQINRTQTSNKGRKWNRVDSCSEDFTGFARHAMVSGICGSYQENEKKWISESLQNRYCLPSNENSYRSRWEQSQAIAKTGSGQEKNRVIVWHGVDSVKVHERSDTKEFGELCRDGRVYNLEVEKLHTYTANNIAVHNCHHSSSKSYTDIINKYPDAYILGVTATPCRSDGQGFKWLFDDLVCGIAPSELIDLGHLSKFKLFGANQISTKGVGKSGGDFNQSQLEDKAMSVIGDVVPTWEKNAVGKQTIVFAVSVLHSKAMVKAFLEAGFSAEHIDGETPDKERDEIIGRFRDRTTTILSNVGIFTEGFDLAGIEVVQCVRPTMSLSLWLQMVGRGLRPSEGKEHCIIIDHSDNWKIHGLPDESREWSLEPASLKPARFTQQCPECKHVFQPLSHEQANPIKKEINSKGMVVSTYISICPNCQNSFEWEMGEGGTNEGRVVQKEVGEIIEIEIDTTPFGLETIKKLIENQQATGKKPGWIYFQLLRTPETAIRLSLGDWRYLGKYLGYKQGWAAIALREAKSKVPHPLAQSNSSISEEDKLNGVWSRILEYFKNSTFERESIKEHCKLQSFDGKTAVIVTDESQIKFVQAFYLSLITRAFHQIFRAQIKVILQATPKVDVPK